MRKLDRIKWMVVAGTASAIGAQLADRVLTTSWQATTKKGPPDDPEYRDVNWPTALAWTAAAGAIGAITEVIARRGAAVAWRRVTGRRPPKPRKRPRMKTRI